MCFFQYSFIKYIDLIQEHLLNLARYKFYWPLVATNILGGGGHLLAAVTSNLIETELANKPRFRALTFLCYFFYFSGGRRNMTSTTWTTTRPG